MMTTKQSEQCETFISFELIKRGYEIVVGKYQDWIRVEVLDEQGQEVMKVVGVDYEDCITMIGAKLLGEQ